MSELYLVQGIGALLAGLLLVVVADHHPHPVASRLRVAIAICLFGIGGAALASWWSGPTLRPETREAAIAVMVWLAAALSVCRLFLPKLESKSGRRPPPCQPRAWK